LERIGNDGWWLVTGERVLKIGVHTWAIDIEYSHSDKSGII